MPRRYRRRRYALSRPVKTAKYSNETYAAAFNPVTDTQSHVIVTPAGPAGGVRKCKNFTLNLYTATPAYWALIFMPQGVTPADLDWALPAAMEDNVQPAATLFEPNQNVIMSGITDNSSQVQRYKTRLARNLNQGDHIVFIFKPISTVAQDEAVALSINYAIAY